MFYMVLFFLGISRLLYLTYMRHKMQARITELILENHALRLELDSPPCLCDKVDLDR